MGELSLYILLRDWDLNSLQFNLPSQRCLIAGAATIFLVGIIFGLRYAYKNGWPLAIRFIGWFYNRFYAYWPVFPYSHTSWVIGGASLMAFVVFLPFTDDLIVNVTAFYATILFLEGTLRKEVPILSVEFNQNPPWSKESDTNLVDREDDEFVVKQRIRLENFGDASADNLTVMCRAVCPDSGVTRDWKRVEFGDDEAPRLEPNDSQHTEVVLDSFDEYTGQQYLTEVKIKPNVRQGHLAIRKLHYTNPRKPDNK
ncbi:hypothetical protein [Natronobacterium texcoconense]|uniref:Uncharacterized protein n=1 Tax=Natronobacterium texcoconense TaxID=1095778 RepID=A0A1H1CES1_NATTX|nr:hypothetical protein [Natronobacterium texcoconense]SDQ62693.1 hypothetical protein SAMN04489842_1379 [Natronobacterium texcoconense]